MTLEEILTHCDHTLLRQDATWEEIRQVCEDAMTYHCASVCLPPCHVRRAADYVENRLKVGTVIGFPNGYSTTQVKVFETEDAIRNGADEIDMVINLGWVREKQWDQLADEIKAIKASCQGRILKVIVETCLLSEPEKIRLCEIVTQAGADYIKTSTGFSTSGAKLEDIILFHSHIGPGVKIKAAGGIRTKDAAQAFLKGGADRLGASALVGLAKNKEAQ